MRKWVMPVAAAGTLFLGAGWAAAGGVGNDPAAEAVKEFYAEMNRDGEKVRLKAVRLCRKAPYIIWKKNTAAILTGRYSGRWYIFRALTGESSIIGRRLWWRSLVGNGRLFRMARDNRKAGIMAVFACIG